jgi:acetyl-CoA acetyltransferase
MEIRPMRASGTSVAIVGVGESTYYKRGAAPVDELVLTCDAVLAAARDAGLDPRDIDGFASFSDDRTHPTRLGGVLGSRAISFSNMVWGSGGGGCAAAVGNAAAAVVAGLASHVVVYRGLAQGPGSRFGQGDYPDGGDNSYADFIPYGMFAPVHGCALQTRRFMHEHSVTQDPLAAIALTSYAHAQRNPRAVMHGRALDRETYNASRWIAEPFHLFDCCQESDGAAAVIVTSLDRARDLNKPPVLILGAAQGSVPRQLGRDRTSPPFSSANFGATAARVFSRAGVGPGDVDVLQAYENFTGGVMVSLVEHGFCAPDEVDEFMTEETFRWDGGRLPLNTSGGNLAEAYIHGLELVNESVRQVRGESTCQVSDAEVAMVIGGPFDRVVSNLVLGPGG